MWIIAKKRCEFVKTNLRVLSGEAVFFYPNKQKRVLKEFIPHQNPLLVTD